MLEFSLAPQKPWSLQMTVTYGCNRSCEFCGIYGIDQGGKRFIHTPVELAVLVAKQLNEAWPDRRVELDTHGDPGLNPAIWDIVAAFNQYAPKCQIQMQTNGVKFRKDFDKEVAEFYKVGGDLLVIDCYGDAYDRFTPQAVEFCIDHPEIQFVDYNHDNPERFSYWANYHKKVKALIVTDDLGNSDVIQLSPRSINNHAGSADPEFMTEYFKQRGSDYKDEMLLDKPCTRVYREIVVNPNGEICLCCNSWLHQYIHGNVYQDHLYNIWNSRPWNIVRQLMKEEDRVGLRPCDVCTYRGGFRTGLCKHTELEDYVFDHRGAALDELHEHMRGYTDYIHWNGYAELNGKRLDSTYKKPEKTATVAPVPDYENPMMLS